MPYPPANWQDIFTKEYWTQLAAGVNADPGILNPHFWDDSPGPNPEPNSWTGANGFLSRLRELHEFLSAQGRNVDYADFHVYKTLASTQDLQDIYDWHSQGFHKEFRSFVANQAWNNMQNAAVAGRIADRCWDNLLGGHLGCLDDVVNHAGAAQSILKFRLRRAAPLALFQDNSWLAFTRGQQTKRVAIYFRHVAANPYEIRSFAGEGGEGLQAGTLGVKCENNGTTMSFAIGANRFTKALFSILVDRCEWQREPSAEVRQGLTRNYLQR